MLYAALRLTCPCLFCATLPILDDLNSLGHSETKMSMASFIFTSAYW